MTFSIIGATISGNKGAAGMLDAAIQSLSEKYPNSHFKVFSYYYKKDKKLNNQDNVEVLNYNPLFITLILIPFCLPYYIIRKIGLPIFYFRGINKEIDAFINSDAVLDLSGISFSDGREIYLLFNTAILLPPLLLGRKIIKCAQALGPFDNPINRIVSKLFLPKISLIIARGKETFYFLTRDLNLKNVKMGADYAFSLKIDKKDKEKVKKYLNNPVFKSTNVVGVGPSQVVYEFCKKNNLDYVDIIYKFIEYLISEGHRVAIIPHSVRKSNKKKNNDLPLCNEIYEKLNNKSNIIFVNDDLSPMNLKVLIGSCRFFVGSRFHAGIAALSMNVPVLIIGWSHKYREVFNMFNLKQYAIEYDGLNLKSLIYNFQKMVMNEKEIRSNINKNLPNVKKQSEKHLVYINKIINHYPGSRFLGEFTDKSKEYYLGKYINTSIGHSLNPIIRKGAASGGTVSSILSYLLETGQIRGAIVSKIYFSKGKLQSKAFIATTRKQILASKSSIYCTSDHFSVLKDVKKFNGKLAVVALPCQIARWKEMCAQDKGLADKIEIFIGLFCGHSSQKSLIIEVLNKKGIKESLINDFKFKRGLWRGESYVSLKGGEKIKFSYPYYSLYQNLFIKSEKKCLTCSDHTAESADLSCGDIWDYQFKKLDIKQNAIIVRSINALKILDEMKNKNKLDITDVGAEMIYRAQNRSLIYHKHIKARAKVARCLFNYRIKYSSDEESRWNDYLAALMILSVIKISDNRLGGKLIFKLPQPILKIYLIAFKGLTSF